MRITFVCPSFSMTGGIRVVATYAEYLRRRGHTVLAVAPAQREPSFREIARSILRRHPIPKPGKETYFDRTQVDHRMLNHLKPVTDADVPDADVVIATWWETAEWVAQLSPTKGKKVFFIQHHEVEFEYVDVPRVKATWRLPLHKITISQWLVDLARESYGDSDVDLVFNSVEQELFHAPPRQKNKTPVIGMMYSTHSLKACHIGLKAFAEVCRQRPATQLVSFGQVPVDASLPLPRGAQFWQSPAQESIRDIYSRCDVWLCSSRSEGFHLPPLEAMACRCPVVSTRVGGPADIIQDGVNGFLANVNDVETLTNQMLKVIDFSEAEWRAMSDAAYATAVNYTWDDATDRFEAALKRTIQNPRPR